MKLFKKIFFAFVLLIASYCVLLTITFFIPQHSIESNAEKSLQMVEKEGMYPSINQGNMLGTRLDNFTDHLMIRKTKADPELNSLENAMSMADYPRYWHGYQLFTTFTARDEFGEYSNDLRSHSFSADWIDELLFNQV